MPASAHPHAELWAIEAIEPPHSFPIHQPTFAPQQYPNVLIPKLRPGMGKIVHPQPKGGLILRSAPSIPRRPSKLVQATDPRTIHREAVPQPLGQFSAAGGPQPVFRRASDSTCLSMERSATSRFNRLFSSSSCGSRHTTQMGILLFPG